jgi:hypothetical protein
MVNCTPHFPTFAIEIILDYILLKEQILIMELTLRILQIVEYNAI